MVDQLSQKWISLLYHGVFIHKVMENIFLGEKYTWIIFKYIPRIVSCMFYEWIILPTWGDFSLSTNFVYKINLIINNNNHSLSNF